MQVYYAMVCAASPLVLYAKVPYTMSHMPVDMVALDADMHRLSDDGGNEPVRHAGPSARLSSILMNAGDASLRDARSTRIETLLVRVADATEGMAKCLDEILDISIRSYQLGVSVHDKCDEVCSRLADLNSTMRSVGGASGSGVARTYATGVSTGANAKTTAYGHDGITLMLSTARVILNGYLYAVKLANPDHSSVLQEVSDDMLRPLMSYVMSYLSIKQPSVSDRAAVTLAGIINDIDAGAGNVEPFTILMSNNSYSHIISSVWDCLVTLGARCTGVVQYNVLIALNAIGSKTLDQVRSDGAFMPGVMIDFRPDSTRMMQCSKIGKMLPTRIKVATAIVLDNRLSDDEKRVSIGKLLSETSAKSGVGKGYTHTAMVRYGLVKR
jgi:hypothetical protein